LPQIPGADVAAQDTNEIEEVKLPRPETPSTTQPPSEKASSTTPTTPSSVQTSTIPAAAIISVTKPAPKIAAAVPIVPAIPKSSSRASPITAVAEQRPQELDAKQTVPEVAVSEDNKDPSNETDEGDAKSAPVATGPKTWSGLFKGGPPVSTPAKNGTLAPSASLAVAGTFSKANNDSLADALRVFNATSQDAKLAFLKPRGLINTGNMCYMNSVS
jgi:ubiquitin carboxyl-terminal hydrolase 10